MKYLETINRDKITFNNKHLIRLDPAFHHRPDPENPATAVYYPTPLHLQTAFAQLEIFMQRVQIHILDFVMFQVLMTFFGSTLGLSHAGPVRSLVTGTFEPILVNECLKQMQRVMINFNPVRRDSFDVQRQNL